MIRFCRADFALSFGVLWSYFQSNFHNKIIYGRKTWKIFTFCIREIFEKKIQAIEVWQRFNRQSWKFVFRGNFSCSFKWHIQFSKSKFFGNVVGWWSRGCSLKSTLSHWIAFLRNKPIVSLSGTTGTVIKIAYLILKVLPKWPIYIYSIQWSDVGKLKNKLK
jgi:hypothetical protein